MRRLLVLVIGLGVTWIGSAEPAGACSCAAPDPAAPVVAFDGVTRSMALGAGHGPLWTVEVLEVLEGDVAGDEVPVLIDHPVEQGGVVAASSCSIGEAPLVDATYRFTVAPVEEDRPFHVGQCSGSIELVSATSPASSAGGGDDDPPYALYVGGALAAVTVLGVLVARR